MLFVSGQDVPGSFILITVENYQYRNPPRARSMGSLCLVLVSLQKWNHSHGTRR